MNITAEKAHMLHDDDELNGMNRENAKSIKENRRRGKGGGWQQREEIEMET
jgi:hypothetical protein